MVFGQFFFQVRFWDVVYFTPLVGFREYNTVKYTLMFVCFRIRPSVFLFFGAGVFACVRASAFSAQIPDI